MLILDLKIDLDCVTRAQKDTNGKVQIDVQNVLRIKETTGF
jgi:hypothetical protein